MPPLLVVVSDWSNTQDRLHLGPKRTLDSTVIYGQCSAKYESFQTGSDSREIFVGDMVDDDDDVFVAVDAVDLPA